MALKKLPNITLFLLIVLSYLTITYGMSESLKISDLTYRHLLEILPKKQVDQYFNLQQKYQWVSYVVFPLLLLLKLTLVALCLSLGKFFTFIDKKFRFGRYFRIALWAEVVFILVSLIKWGYFWGLKTNFSLKELQLFYPLSALNLFDIDKIEPWLVYPLQTLNLFEVFYGLLLAYGMQKLLSITFGKAFEMVMYAYGGALFIWVGLVTFLTLNFT